jgi:hypothetical protein
MSSSVYSIFRKLANADLNSKNNQKPAKVKPIPELIAYCKRLASRNITVGNTLFKFNKNGRTSVLDLGNNRLDYAILLRMNGVTPEER